MWSAFSGDSAELIFDERYYAAYGQHLAQGEGLYADQYFGRFYSYRGPGYPIWIALCFWLSPHSPLNALRTSQVLLHLINARLTWIISKRTIPISAARVAEMLVLFNPTLWRTALHVIPMTLSLTIWLTVVAIWVRKAPDARSAVLLGTMAAFGWMTRTDFVALFAAVLIISVTRNASERRFAMIAAAMFILTSTPWIVRNWYLHRTFVLVTSTGKQIADGNYHNAPGDQIHRFLERRFDPAYQALQLNHPDPFNEVEWNRRLLAYAWREVATHPTEAIWRAIRKIGYAWNTNAFETIWVWSKGHPAVNMPCRALWFFAIIDVVWTFILYTLFLSSVLVRGSRMSVSGIVNVAAVLLSLVVVIGVGQPRYLFPLIPLMPVAITQAVSEKKRAVLTASVVVAVLLMIAWILLNPWGLLGNLCEMR